MEEKLVLYIVKFMSNTMIYSYQTKELSIIVLVKIKRPFFYIVLVKIILILFFYLLDAFETSISLTYLYGFFSNFQGICNLLKFI